MNTNTTTEMTNQAQGEPKVTAPMLVELAERMGVNPSQAYMTIKATIAPKANNEELMAFCVVANQYKLNPFLKEIYAFPGKSGGIVPIVGIDGWLKLINTHPKFDGMDVEMSDDGKECTCRIYRKDNQHPTVITEYLEECKRNTDPWKQWPRRMLRHKAIMQCGRVAFGFGGIYDEDEGKDVAARMRNVTPEKTDGSGEWEAKSQPGIKPPLFKSREIPKGDVVDAEKVADAQRQLGDAEVPGKGDVEVPPPHIRLMEALSCTEEQLNAAIAQASGGKVKGWLEMTAGQMEKLAANSDKLEPFIR